MKELQHCVTKNYFCVRQQLKLLCNKIIYTSAHQTKQLHVRKLISFLMNNIYLAFFYLEMQKDSQTFKSCSCKKFFPSVYVIGATCFNECFLLHVIIGTPHFL